MNEDDRETMDDAMGARLRDEATAERPAFSPALHQRVLNGVRSEAAATTTMMTRQWPWPRAIAAGVVVAIGIGLVVTVVARRQRREGASLPTVARAVPAAPAREARSLTEVAAAVTRPVNIGGVLSAQLWPPEIGVRVPGITGGTEDVSAQSPTPAKSPPPAPPGSPEWLLARLQAPTERAAEVFGDVMPPEVRAALQQPQE